MSDKNKFLEIMSNKTDEELIKIVTVDRDNYELVAIEAADSEVKSRNIDQAQIIEVQNALSQKKAEQNTIDANKVSSGTRLIHFVVDTLSYFAITMILVLPLDLIFPYDSSLGPIIAILLLTGTYFTYYMAMEYFFQKTLGKFITKTKVVKENGEKPSLLDIFGRTFCRLIPFDRLSFLFMKNGLHDMLSKTSVIKDKK